MFFRVSQVEQPLAMVVGSLDPAALSGVEARLELQSVLRMQKLLDGAKLRLLARVDETRSWTGSGDRSLEGWLTRLTGGTYGAAAKAAETASLLGDAPEVAKALKDGKLSAAQAAAIAPAAKEAPAQAKRLVDGAASQTLRDTRQAAERVRAAARSPQQEEERATKQRAKRRLTFGTDEDGNGTIEAHLPPPEFAEVKAELERLWKPIFRKARADGRHEPHQAYAADALVEAARRSRITDTRNRPAEAPDTETPADATHTAEPADPATGTEPADTTEEPVAAHEPADSTEALVPEDEREHEQPEPDQDPGPVEPAEPTTETATGERGVLDLGPAPPGQVAINVIVDLDTLQQRERTDGEGRCDIPGTGPVPVSWVLDRLGEATLRLFLRKGLDLTTLATPGRSPTQTMGVCLDILYPTCAIENCGVRRNLEDHHDTSATGWADTHRTRLDEITRLCKHHHDLVTHDGYTLVPGPTHTTATLVPPDQPAPPRRKWGKKRNRAPEGPPRADARGRNRRQAKAAGATAASSGAVSQPSLL